MDSVDAFALESIRFEEWANSTESDPSQATRSALIRLSSLYLAGLRLPKTTDRERNARHSLPDTERANIDVNANVTVLGSIPVDMYGEVFRPLELPPEEPVIGSVADDLKDIYREILTGLRTYQAGNKAGAHWKWRFGFQHHWGEHATGAIRAIHAWLTENEP